MEQTTTTRDGQSERIVTAGTVDQDFAVAQPAVRSAPSALLAGAEPCYLEGALLWGAWSLLKAIGFRPLW